MSGDVFLYHNSFTSLNEDLPLAQKFDKVRAVINSKYPYITRIATALYDKDSDLLKTFLQSGDSNPLQWYEAKLADSPSLVEIKQERLPRVVNNLDIFAKGDKLHTKAISDQGFRASYTLPIHHKRDFIGFIFFNSNKSNVFCADSLAYLDSVANLLSQSIIQQMVEVRVLLGAVKTIQEIAHTRDNETGDHLRRMACYARLIAKDLAPKYELSDQFIEYIHLFAPLHDVGKIAIPDDILLKAGPLTKDEFDIMKTHTSEGRKIIESMLEHFNLRGFEYAGMLTEIVEDHHEMLNGGGYRKRLAGGSISLAARIIATADVFDALTSKRPYKEAWSNQQAIDMLTKMAGNQLDEDCVAALCGDLERIREVQARFSDHEDPLPTSGAG